MTKWIQKAVKKKGALHRQLGIPEGKPIPVSLLKKIAKAEIGSKVAGKKVTHLLKRRAVLALTLKRLSKKKKRKKKKGKKGRRKKR